MIARVLGNAWRRLGAAPKDDLLIRLARASTVTLFIKVGAAGLTFLMLLLIARAMVVEDYGRFALGFSVASFLGVAATVGFHEAILRWLPEYKAKGDAGQGRQLLYFAMQVVAGAGVAAALATVAIAFIVADGAPYLLATAILIVPLALSEYFAAALRALGSIVGALAPKDVLWRLFGVGLAGGYVLADARLAPGTALLLMAAALGVLVAGQAYLIKVRADAEVASVVPSALPNERLSRGGALRVAWPMWVSSLMINAGQHLDVVLVGLFLAPEQTAAYFAASRIAGLLSFPWVAMNVMASPIIATLHHSGDREGLQKMLNRGVALMAVPTLIGLAIFVIGGSWILSLFNQGFGSLQGVLILLSISFALTALAGPSHALMQMTGNQTPYLKILGVGYGVGLLVLLMLLPVIGVWAAGVGHLISSLIRNVWIRQFALRHIQVEPTLLSLFPRARPKLPRL